MDKAKVMIVALQPEDWRELRAIRLEALRSAPEAFSSTYEETRLQPDEFWQRRLANDRAVHLIAREHERPIGMVGGYLGDDDGDQSVAVVFGMYVTQQRRGQQIGRLLLRALIGRLAAQPDIAAIRFWVGEAQHPARRLDESLGFRVVGRSEEPQSNELIMEFRVRSA
jgi:GNAT superfamily N-acetyltransferase